MRLQRAFQLSVAQLSTDTTYDIERVRMVIHQPRRDHVDEWELPVADLMAWANSTLKIAVLDATAENARRVPGEKQCQWCPAKATCPELAQQIIDVVTEGFDSDEGHTLAALLNYVDMARSWASAIEARAMDELLGGSTVDGWKLVDGRSTRAWKDEVEIAGVLVEKLGDDAYNKKLLSPAQAEKVIGRKSSDWDIIESNHITWSIPKPTLARESSRKQAITPNPLEGFDS